MNKLNQALIAKISVVAMAAGVVLHAPSANAYTLSEIAGSYRITSKQVAGVVNLVTLSAKGDIVLKEVSNAGTIVCKGQSKFADNLLRSIVKCADQTVFYRQQIDFSAVRNLKKFQAPVASDLFGATITMDFEKVQSVSNERASANRENHDFCLDAISQLSKAAYHRGMAHTLAQLDHAADTKKMANSMREKHEDLLKDTKFYCSRNWVEGQR